MGQEGSKLVTSAGDKLPAALAGNRERDSRDGDHTNANNSAATAAAAAAASTADPELGRPVAAKNAEDGKEKRGRGPKEEKAEDTLEFLRFFIEPW